MLPVCLSLVAARLAQCCGLRLHIRDKLVAKPFSSNVREDLRAKKDRHAEVCGRTDGIGSPDWMLLNQRPVIFLGHEAFGLQIG